MVKACFAPPSAKYIVLLEDLLRIGSQSYTTLSQQANYCKSLSMLSFSAEVWKGYLVPKEKYLTQMESAKLACVWVLQQKPACQIRKKRKAAMPHQFTKTKTLYFLIFSKQVLFPFITRRSMPAYGSVPLWI